MKIPYNHNRIYVPILYIITFISILNTSQAQTVKVYLESKPSIFDVDKLGNIYVYSNYELKKYSYKGKLLYTYSQNSMSKLYSIDVSDPMQILLYYKDFNQIVFLDRHLNTIGDAILLNSLNINSASTICKSNQWGIWIYDDFENELINFAFNTKSITDRIKLKEFNANSSEPNYLVEYDNLLYINESNSCIWVFDKFGNQLNKLQVETSKDFQVIKGNILCKNMYFDNKQNKTFNQFDNIRFNNKQWYYLIGKIIIITTKSILN